MGKISRRQKNRPKPKEKNKSNDTGIDEFAKILDINNRSDSDTVSVRSFKSSKMKLGIKKQLTKADKMKFRKELLKRKMTIQKDMNGMKPGSQIAEDKLDFSNFQFFDKPESTGENKIETSKPLAKRKKRRKDFTKDVDQLKKLMLAKLKMLKSKP